MCEMRWIGQGTGCHILSCGGRALFLTRETPQGWTQLRSVTNGALLQLFGGPNAARHAQERAEMIATILQEAGLL